MKPIPVHNQYLISVQRPHLWLLSVLGILAVICLLIMLAYEHGRHVAGFDKAETESEIEFLQKSLNDLSAEKDNLLRENAKLSRGRDIDQDAGSQVQKTLAEEQAKILEMKEELTFYRNIVAPSKDKRTVEIKKVFLTAEGNNQYNYKVVLIQDGRHDVPVRGVVEISVEGQQADGQIVTMNLSSISTKKIKNQQIFGFKYFQNFEGGIRFPEKFVPLSMHIRVLPKTSRVPDLNEQYNWDELIAGGDQNNVGQTEK
ncbi:MAG: hypothetical protein OEY43_00045 [Gammaproteobacteria bacterium]|nr:hypothetical protein [Gammaproteobacteria bacterium]